mmetsp:Transcript_15435/g.27073  ORF Transcript_15435/g.27073 Transcript_15435/m.27073 type:complete len:230 (+) Transcript_15435:730-1419(+)
MVDNAGARGASISGLAGPSAWGTFDCCNNTFSDCLGVASEGTATALATVGPNWGDSSNGSLRCNNTCLGAATEVRADGGMGAETKGADMRAAEFNGGKRGTSVCATICAGSIETPELDSDRECVTVWVVALASKAHIHAFVYAFNTLAVSFIPFCLARSKAVLRSRLFNVGSAPFSIRTSTAGVWPYFAASIRAVSLFRFVWSIFLRFPSSSDPFVFSLRSSTARVTPY